MQRELAKGEVARIKVSQLETERKELREQLEAAKERAERFVKNKKKNLPELISKICRVLFRKDQMTGGYGATDSMLQV